MEYLVRALAWSYYDLSADFFTDDHDDQNDHDDDDEHDNDGRPRPKTDEDDDNDGDGDDDGRPRRRRRRRRWKAQVSSELISLDISLDTCGLSLDNLACAREWNLQA